MHHADAGGARVARRAEADRLAVDAHLAGVAGVDAGDDFHQRALAGAVFAREAVDRAGGSAKSTPRNAWTPPNALEMPVSSSRAGAIAASSAAQIRN